MKTRKLVFIALLVAMGIALQIIESFIPLAFALPGARVGVANIVTLLALSEFGFKDGLRVSLLRSFLASLLMGTFLTVTFYLSFSGAVFSALVMGFVLYVFSDQLSLVGVSILGAVSHNAAQITTAYFVIGHGGIFFYFPYLMLFALPTGFFVGISANYIKKYFSIHTVLKDIS